MQDTAKPAISPLDREKAEVHLKSDNPQVVIEILLAIALYETDVEWTQSICAKYAKDPNDSVRGTAILCFGHIARTHGQIDRAKVIPIVREAMNDPSAVVRGQADTALDTILRYVRGDASGETTPPK